MRSIALLILLLLGPTVGRVAALSEPSLVSSLFGQKHTNATPLVPGAYDRETVTLVGEILQRSHYRGQALNDSVSTRFLERYLDALDPQHLFFFQSDLDEFKRFESQLDNLILESGDAQPARVIFRRFRQRLNQQYDCVREVLEKETLAFQGTNRYLLNRKEQPRPKDLSEAQQLWSDRLHYEYLQEKLAIGRPEVIAGLVRETLETKKPEDLQEALKDKVSKEKSEALQKLVKERFQGDNTAEVVSAVQKKLQDENQSEIVKIIARRYNRILRSLNEYDNDDVLQLYLTALANIYDPHSDYMGKAALENFSIGMKLSLSGIGAVLQSEDGYCKIVSLTANGPAERSKKLKPNDKIIAVAQGEEEFVDAVDMKLSKVVDMIRGPKGTEVRLTIIPADAADPSVRKVVSLTRDEVKLEDQEAKAKLFEIPQENGQPLRIGVIDLASFYSSFEIAGGRQSGSEPKSTTADVARLIKKLIDEKISGIILDLRRNGGGSLEEAINLTGLFIKEGPVVQVQEPGGRVLVDKDPNPGIYYRGPLVVLTSRFSASASEILAGALQDYGRALIVGDSATHGKGTVQSLVQLGPILRQQKNLPNDVNPGALKITIRKFYRANGASTQREGIHPDIVLPSVNNHADIGEAALENALPGGNIEAAEFEKFNWIEPFLPELRRRSESRVAVDRDFAFVRQEIERYKKSIQDKTVSLNEAQRLQEKKEADERIAARKKDLAARPHPPGKVFDLSLKSVDAAGLPEKKEVQATDTNANAAAKAALGASAEEDEDDAKPMLDITLEEAKRILLDLISLNTKSSPMTAASRGKAASNAP